MSFCRKCIVQSVEGICKYSKLEILSCWSFWIWSIVTILIFLVIYLIIRNSKHRGKKK